ncbi:transient receptor potential cation channel subfamily M member 4 [Biomphalaria glabrata]
MKDCFNRGRWLIYFSSGWNIVDMLSILLFIIGAALRIVASFNSTSDIWFDLARLALCVDFIIFTLRLLHNCYSNQVLGPTCSMIFKTVLVLMKFLYILAVIWISYAVASEAILYPNSVLNSYTMFFLLRKAYWQMFGQFFLDEIDAGKPTDPNTLACTTDKNLYADYLELRCPTYLGRYVAPILMAVYVMFVNILLFNLITATFTKSIKKIQVQSGKLWRFQFFELTRDFSKVTFLPLPFTPVSMLARKLNESKKDEDGFSIYHQRSDHRARENALESSIRELEEVLDNQLKDINILKQAKENIKYQKVISRTRLDTIKKTFNEIEKFLIKMAIMDYLIKKPAENAQTLIAIQDNEKHCLLNKLIQYKENELSKNGKTANDKNMLGSNKNELDLWDKHVNGLLAEICKFGQENDIIQHIFKEIKNLKKHKYTSAAQLDTVKNLEQKVEELNQIRLPKIFDKTNVQDRRVNRIRAVRRRLEDLHCLLEQSPDQSIIDQNDNFFFQLQEKLKGLKTALTSLQCIYIRRETLNKINAFSDIVSQDIKGRDLLETEAKIKDLEVYVIQNHMEPKMQKKNFKAEDEQESSEEEPDDKVDTLSRNTKSKDDKTSLSKDDKENTEDDIPFIHWIPMYSDSQVTVNNDDSTTFIQEPEELKSISFNHKDTKHHVDRRSYMGRYELHDGKPLNPLWDKTSEGFSSLKRWGPNHFGIPVITRIKRKKNKIFRKANKVELEFLVRKSNLPGQYEFPQIPCFPNQDPFTEFMRDKSNYVKKVLKKHLSLSSIENLLNAVRQLRVLNRWRKPEPNPGTSPSTKLSHAENVEHKSPTISKTKSKLCETFRNWFRKSKKPEPLTSMLNSQIHVRSCQKVNTVYIGVAEEEMSKHKWKEIRIINYHNPNAENQAKLETDVSLEWVDSSKYKDIKEVKFISIKETTGKDIVKFVCALHDAYTERPASAAIVAVGKTMS